MLLKSAGHFAKLVQLAQAARGAAVAGWHKRARPPGPAPLRAGTAARPRRAARDQRAINDEATASTASWSVAVANARHGSRMSPAWAPALAPKGVAG